MGTADMSKKNIEDKYIDQFAEYLISGEPDRAQKAYAWQTAIGLQDVDKIQPSQYLLNTAKDNIEGGIDFDEAKNRIDSYYEENKNHQPERTEEADKVSVRIAEILSENSFVFSPAQYISIHKRLFEGIYSHAGKMRDYNITKKEWVLDEASVIYGGALDLQATLDYDFRIEKEFDYSNLSMSEIITHLARFISKLWQIHIFGEGNTRTSAVFFIKYIRSLGFHATNDVFANNSWYFRNALVRANYTNLSLGVREDLSFLELFLRNLLMGEKNELKNLAETFYENLYRKLYYRNTVTDEDVIVASEYAGCKITFTETGFKVFNNKAEFSVHYKAGMNAGELRSRVFVFCK